MKSLSRKSEYPDEMTCDQMGRYKTLRIFEDLKKLGLLLNSFRGL